MTRPVWMSLLLAAGAAPGCMDLVHVEARASEVCLTGLVIEVPGVEMPEGDVPEVEMPGLSGDSARLEASHVVEEPAAELPAQVDASAHLTGVTLSLRDGAQDFTFLRRARIDVAAEGLPAVSLVDIGEEDSAQLAGRDSWFLAAGGEEDLVEYLLAPALTFDLELEGEMPESDWAVELDLCFSGAARVSAGD